jgi:predicted nucleic-acid-binding protein
VGALRTDANVLVRYLTGLTLDQYQSASLLLDTTAAGRSRVVLEDVIVAELAWVLRTFYKLSRTEIRDFIDGLLAYDGVENAAKQALQTALVFYRDRNVDFVDALLAAKAIRDGTGDVYSFDRDFDRRPGVRRRDPGSPL